MASKRIPSALYIIRKRLAGKNFLYDFYFKNKKTLDIGCGEGEFVRLDKANITGVDMNKRVVAKLTNEGCTVTEATSSRLPFADASFEAVHCRNVIEHLQIPDAYMLLSEAARVLAPGGIFVLASEVPTTKFWWTFGHVKPYPPEAIIKLFRAESREEFEGIDTLEYAGVFYFGEYYKNKILYLLSFLLAYFTPVLRREYFLILKRK